MASPVIHETTNAFYNTGSIAEADLVLGVLQGDVIQIGADTNNGAQVSDARVGANITASIAGATLDVLSVQQGTIFPGHLVSDGVVNVPWGVTIESQIDGTTGNTGHYLLNQTLAMPVSSEPMKTTELNIGATFTGSIVDTTLDVSAVAIGSLGAGQLLTDFNANNKIQPNTLIDHQVSGIKGSIGTYIVTVAQPSPVASEGMQASNLVKIGQGFSMSVWSGMATSNLAPHPPAQSILLTYGTSYNTTSVIAATVRGALPTAAFDPNASLPSISTGNPAPTPAPFSTTLSDDLILFWFGMFVGFGGGPWENPVVSPPNTITPPIPIATFSGSITGPILTASTPSVGTIAVGDLLTGASVSAGQSISAFGTGTGGAGTYILGLSEPSPIAAETLQTSRAWTWINGLNNTSLLEPIALALYTNTVSAPQVGGSVSSNSGSLEGAAYLVTALTADSLPPDVPTNEACGAATPTSITAMWSAGGGSAPASYALQWRKAGTVTWTVVTGIEATAYVITGLQPGTSYEWQVKAIGSTNTVTETITDTTKTTWTVPADWPQGSGSAKIEAIGGGGAGGWGGSATTAPAHTGGAGGGGAAFAREDRISVLSALHPGDVVPIQIGAGGHAATAVTDGGTGGDTFVKTAGGSSTMVLAKGGGGGGSGALGHRGAGPGGPANLCVGNYALSGGGGYGGPNLNVAPGVGGGGGAAAGPYTGNGLGTPRNGHGSYGSRVNGQYGAGAGGGAYGNAANGTAAHGGTGGIGYASQAGGAGGTAASPNGSPGLHGSGGGGAWTYGAGGVGGAGGAGTRWTAAGGLGAGGGGGASGYGIDASSATGGKYGGGSGGRTNYLFGTDTGKAPAGAQGLLVITYTSTAMSDFSPIIICTTLSLPPPVSTPQSLSRWRGQVGINWQGLALVGDAFSGVVGLSDFENFTEYGNMMRFLITSPPIQDDRKRIFMPRFEVDMEVGDGVVNAPQLNPQMMLDYSRDGGETWEGLQKWRGMGAVGEYTKRLRWLNLGNSRSWVFRLQCTDQQRRQIIGVYTTSYKGRG